MLKALTICALITIPVSAGNTQLMPGNSQTTVRIGLFSLFNPEMLNLKSTRGGTATIETGGTRGTSVIKTDDSVRIRLRGRRIDIVLLDSHGRVERSINTVEVNIFSQQGAGLELIIPGKIKREVRGQLSITASRSRGRNVLQITLATELESAVASITAAEMRGHSDIEAIKALSIIARTYMLSHSGRHSSEGFDFCDTTHCQLYRGEADLSEQVDSPIVASAVVATAGEWLSFEGEPVEVYFTAVCGGLTATPEMVWGGATGGRYTYRRIICHWCSKSQYINWERSAAASKVIDAISTATGRRFSSEAELAVEREKVSDITLKVFIRDRGRQMVMTADEFRRAVGHGLGWNRVLSPTFDIARRGAQFIFRGRGFGSQAGLCLIGAVAQAEAGRSYRDILSFYYPQAEVVRSARSLK